MFWGCFLVCFHKGNLMFKRVCQKSDPPAWYRMFFFTSTQIQPSKTMVLGLLESKCALNPLVFTPSVRAE